MTLEEVGLNATKCELEIAAMKSLNSLTEIQIIAEEQKLFKAVQQVKESIKEINNVLPKPK